MATKTERDVITLALQGMGHTAFGEVADADEYALALPRYDAMHSVMRDRHKGRWAWQKDSVPDDLYVLVADMLAGRLLGTFRTGERTAQEVRAAAGLAERELSQYILKKPRITVQLQVV